MFSNSFERHSFILFGALGEKGNYEVIPDETGEEIGNIRTEGLRRSGHWYSSARLQMTVLTLLGAGAMLLHHFFYLHLSGTRVNTTPIPGLRFSEQALIGAIGNAIASAASFFFGTAIGIVFVQALWVSLRRKFHSIKGIGAILECRTSPFTPAAWSAWSAAWKLTALALLSASMTGITIFAPGALRTASVEYAYKAPCTIPFTDLSTGDFGTTEGPTWTPSPAVKKMTLTNLLIGEVIPPASPCGSCAYDVVFNAPGMNCSNTTDSYPFQYIEKGSTAVDVIIWNGTHDVASGGNTIVIATTEGYELNYEAVTCNVYNATYDVRIQHNGTQTSIDVQSVELHQPITSDDMQSSVPEGLGMYTISLALAQHLYGIGMVDVGKMIAVDVDNQNHNVFYSALGSPGPAGSKTWKWQPNTLETLPQLMQNVSISMLSNPLGGTTIPTETQCLYSAVFYDYNPLQLALAYGIATLTTLICVVIGFWAVERNSAEESLGFSRVLVSILNSQLFNATLNGETQVIASPTPSGHLIPSQ